MLSAISLLAPLMLDRAAVTAVEYVIVAAVLATSIIAGFEPIGAALQGTFNTVAAAF